MKLKAIASKQTKAQILSDLSKESGLSKKDVRKVLEALRNQAVRHLKKGGSGEITVPELGIKLRRRVRPARPVRMVRNPFTGEMMKAKAKPASITVRAVPLKSLKDEVA